MRKQGYFRPNAKRAESHRREKALWKDLKHDMFPELFVKDNWRRFRYQPFFRTQGLVHMKHSHICKDHTTGKTY